MSFLFPVSTEEKAVLSVVFIATALGIVAILTVPLVILLIIIVVSVRKKKAMKNKLIRQQYDRLLMSDNNF